MPVIAVIGGIFFEEEFCCKAWKNFNKTKLMELLKNQMNKPKGSKKKCTKSIAETMLCKNCLAKTYELKQ